MPTADKTAAAATAIEVLPVSPYTNPAPNKAVLTTKRYTVPTPQAGYIFTGVFAILIFASVIGQWLKRKNGADNATISNLNARIYAWWLMTLVLLVAFWFGQTGTVALFFLISFAALREFMALVYRRRSDYYSMVVCFYLLLPV